MMMTFSLSFCFQWDRARVGGAGVVSASREIKRSVGADPRKQIPLVWVQDPLLLSY
jgi:hypothetical protein